MRIRMLTDLGDYKAGREYEVPLDEAMRLIKEGFAEAAEVETAARRRGRLR